MQFNRFWTPYGVYVQITVTTWRLLESVYLTNHFIHHFAIGSAMWPSFDGERLAECELRDHAAPSAGSLATAFDDSTAAPEWSCRMEHRTDK